MRYEKEFRASKPETVGETDKAFDLCNYIDWLETEFEELRQVKNNVVLGDVSQQRELLELVTEIANSNQVYSNTRHKLWAKKLISSNCG